MDTFSSELLSFARGYLGGGIEQYNSFMTQIQPGRTGCDLDTGLAWIGERRLARSGQLGTFAEDQTFMWAWAKPDLTGLPGTEHAVRLREIGAAQGIPEFTTELLDLGGFHDPKLAADHLGLIAQGVLGARGMTKFNHGGRAYTYLAIDDETVALAEPDPGTVATWLRVAADLLLGGGARAVIAGYARRHGLTVREIPGGNELALPRGYALRARIDERDNIVDATVVDATGATYRAAPVQRPRPPRQPFVPDDLLARLASAAAITMGLKRGLLDFADGLRELERTTPTWNPDNGCYGIAELPELALAAVELGCYERPAETWIWADNGWAGSAAVRRLAFEAGANHLAAERVSLTPAFKPENVVDLLTAAAVHLGGGVGWVHVPTDDGFRCLAVIDPRITPPGTDPDFAATIFEATANLLNPLTDVENRYRTMREMIVGYFEHFRVPTLYMGEPQLLMGHFGLYELRIEFGVDGALTRAYWGLQGQLGF
ncbi:hypothetical protein OHB26_20255 [Nocardia sp. NBC_01503]|uniref:DUF6882 domain-containing protein n=1 Tax=Nocardia sp. NBC_01503 TaxID=2975997 RepID=UPI002E7B0692|nr:DUF6882 domain-containing protein [Nocardia sp. NBC_01503]WTL29346.1 hypothetical protein OHB26_20255 [Nocardia sp. NBC_01503]